MNGLRFSDDEIMYTLSVLSFPLQHEFENNFPVTDLKVKEKNKTRMS